jgi:hypothetical protein
MNLTGTFLQLLVGKMLKKTKLTTISHWKVVGGGGGGLDK